MFWMVTFQDNNYERRPGFPHQRTIVLDKHPMDWLTAAETRLEQSDPFVILFAMQIDAAMYEKHKGR